MVEYRWLHSRHDRHGLLSQLELLDKWIARFDNGSTGISFPHRVLIAKVNESRVGIWLGLNSVLTASSLLLALLQKRCQHKTVRDPATAALLLDTTALLDQDTTGLCNAITLREDKSLRLCLQMSNHDGLYDHPRVKVDNLDQLPDHKSRRKKGKKHAPKKNETSINRRPPMTDANARPAGAGDYLVSPSRGLVFYNRLSNEARPAVRKTTHD